MPAQIGVAVTGQAAEAGFECVYRFDTCRETGVVQALDDLRRDVVRLSSITLHHDDRARILAKRTSPDEFSTSA